MTSLEQLQMVALGLETKPSLESRGNKKLCTLQAADVIVQMKPVIRSFGFSRKVAVWYYIFPTRSQADQSQICGPYCTHGDTRAIYREIFQHPL